MVFPFLALPARALERLKTKLDGAPAVDHSLMQEVLRLACPDLDERLDAITAAQYARSSATPPGPTLTLALIAYGCLIGASAASPRTMGSGGAR